MKKIILTLLVCLCVVVAIIPIAAIETNEAPKSTEAPETTATPVIVTVTVGEVTTEYASIKEAFEYAKTVANPLIELVGEGQTFDCSDYTENVAMSDFTFIGNGNTITGLTVPLFSRAKNATIKDVVITGADIAIENGDVENGLDVSAVLISYIDGNSNVVVNISGITIKNSSLIGSNYTGAFIGYINNKAMINVENSTVEDTVIIGGGSTGTVVGHALLVDGSKIENINMKNVDVECTDEGGTRPDKVGIIIGRLTLGTVSLSANINDACTVEPKAEDPAADKRICGNLISDGNIVITGGSYPSDPTKIHNGANSNMSIEGGVIKKDPVTGSYGIAAVAVKKSASYKDNIALNFYFNVAEQYKTADFKIIVTLADGSSKEYTIENLEVQTLQDGIEYFKLSHALVAKELADKLSVKIMFGEQELDAFEYSYQDYAEAILSNSSITQKEKDLVAACLNYGAAAQIYFDYNLGNLANSILQ